jgi:hypothetical protein
LYDDIDERWYKAEKGQRKDYNPRFAENNLDFPTEEHYLLVSPDGVHPTLEFTHRHKELGK